VRRWYEHGYHNTLSLRLIFGIIPRIPKLLHPPIAAATALLFLFLLKAERRAVAHNLGKVARAGRLGILWKTYRVFYSFCDFMVSYCYVPGASHDQLRAMLVDPGRGEEKIEECLSLGSGLIVWTAHVGNWEFASRLLEMHGTKANVARAVEQGNPAEMKLRDMMINERLSIIPVNEDPFAPLELLRALRRGEIVAIQGDRAYGGRNASVPFFGERASFPLGPFVISYVSGAPVLPGVVVREGWLRYRVVMGDPIHLPRTGDRDQDLMAGLTQATRFLEESISTYHCQWLNFYRFWSPEEAEGGEAEALTTAASQV
jgi:lauroyl/myristoyl acyltransferase